MSLLLDALKKAAKEKEQAAENSSDDSAQLEENGTETAQPAEEEVELSLEDEPVEATQDEAEPAADDAEATVDEPAEESIEEPPALKLESENVRARTTTVSDEALQMLIFKTNREHRRKQRFIWLSVSVVSVLVLITGGAYFYTGMIEDIESMERKHNIMMQKVHAEKIVRHVPAAPIVSARPATSRTDQSLVVEKVSSATVSDDRSVSARPAPRAVSIERSEKQDPVGVMLNRAYKAYQAGQLEAAERDYRKVLTSEPNNRDALLGQAAVAARAGDNMLARDTYRSLLQLDPNDSIAIAGLTELASRDTDLNESEIKLMLRQRPDDPHLNFTMGNLNAANDRWPQAQTYYFSAWQASPGNADFAYNLAVSLEQIGKSEEAIRFYRMSLEAAEQGEHRFDDGAVAARLEVLGQQ